MKFHTIKIFQSHYHFFLSALFNTQLLYLPNFHLHFSNYIVYSLVSLAQCLVFCEFFIDGCLSFCYLSFFIHGDMFILIIFFVSSFSLSLLKMMYERNSIPSMLKCYFILLTNQSLQFQKLHHLVIWHWNFVRYNCTIFHASKLQHNVK